MYLSIIISALLYLLSFISLHKSLFYPPFVYILYGECSEDVTGEYSSAKYQWRKGRGYIGCNCTALERKVALFKKEFKNEVFHLVLPHFNFWPAIEKCYDVSISTGCQNNS